MRVHTPSQLVKDGKQLLRMSAGSDFFWWPAIEKALTYFMEQAWLAEHSRQQQAANAVAAAAAAAAAAGDHGLLAREVPQVPKEVPIPFHDQTGRPSEVSTAHTVARSCLNVGF
jgi:hypothetical protein